VKIFHTTIKLSDLDVCTYHGNVIFYVIDGIKREREREKKNIPTRCDYSRKAFYVEVGRAYILRARVGLGLGSG